MTEFAFPAPTWEDVEFLPDGATDPIPIPGVASIRVVHPDSLLRIGDRFLSEVVVDTSPPAFTLAGVSGELPRSTGTLRATVRTPKGPGRRYVVAGCTISSA